MKNALLFIGSFCLACILAGCGGSNSPQQQQDVPPPALVITSGALPNGTVGVAYGGGSLGFSLGASGGKAPYTWSWTAVSGSSLPPGLDMTGNSITGTPTTANTYKVVVRVTDSQSPAVHTDTNYTITIAEAPPLAITSSPPAGTALSRYGSPHPFRDNFGRPVTLTLFKLTANGGSGNYSWTWAAAASSSLPPGLNCCSHFFETGSFREGVFVPNIIWGTPTMPGTYQVVLTVSDTSSGVKVSGTYPIVINNPPPPVINTTPALPIGTLNSPYVGYTFTASQGLPPLTWSETGALPGAMQLSSDGVLSGKPTAAGSFHVTLMAKDSVDQDSAPQDFTIQVLAKGFVPTGNLTTTHRNHTATLLNTGKVLVVGGGDPPEIAELYDPNTGKFSQTGSLETARAYHTATLLGDGRVLITGGVFGSGLNEAELFDLNTGKFTRTSGDMTVARQLHAATLLKNGKVLLSGGIDDGSNPIISAEIFDPSTQTFSATGNMISARFSHTATLLVGGPNDGKVLIVGGATNTAERYDPSTGKFTATGNMADSRFAHTATRINDGRILVAGGQGGPGNVPIAQAEIYDPATGTFSSTGDMADSREGPIAVLLPNGKVLVAGGFTFEQFERALSSAELFDPATETFSRTADMISTRREHAAALLQDGEVLVMGGLDAQGNDLSSAELFQ
jgi:hypothetical protein